MILVESRARNACKPFALSGWGTTLFVDMITGKDSWGNFGPRRPTYGLDAFAAYKRMPSSMSSTDDPVALLKTSRSSLVKWREAAASSVANVAGTSLCHQSLRFVEKLMSSAAAVHAAPAAQSARRAILPRSLEKA